jgi:microcystin-dependent protein
MVAMTTGRVVTHGIGASMRNFAILLAGGLLVLASTAAAQVPYAFSPGTPAKAAEVNANFADLDGRVGAVNGRVDSVDARVDSVNGRVDALDGRVDSVDGRLDALTALVEALAAQVVPVGAVMPFAGATPPPGWLLCDGSAVSRTAYAALFAVLGVSHGWGDQAGTFNVPDYRGRFLRGTDGGAGRDPGVAARGPMAPGGDSGGNVGSVQDDEFGSHSHAWTDYGHSHLVGADNTGGWNWGNVGTVSDRHAGDLRTSSSYSNIAIHGTGGSETRPVNAAVNYIIKH